MSTYLFFSLKVTLHILRSVNGDNQNAFQTTGLFCNNARECSKLMSRGSNVSL